MFGGYWQNEAATADAIRDGWFHTGDIGTLDDGYLFITGRKKELIVTAGGKNVSPAQLEDTIRAHPMVSQCLVVGDNKPFIAALITIDPEAVPRLARAPQPPPRRHPPDLDADRERGSEGRDRRGGQGGQLQGLQRRGDQEVHHPRHRLLDRDR